MQMLEVSQLRKSYMRHKKEILAVDNVSFHIDPGAVVGLLGSNGAGKTTTLKCALGLVEPSSGWIRIAGIDVSKGRRMALRHVGAVLEGSRNIYWHLTPIENLTLFANLVGMRTSVARRQAYELLERFNLSDKEKTPSGQLSRGMQQKLSICTALIRNPSLLLLDEPTLGLDVEAADQMREILTELVREKGRTVIICSHQMDLIQSICNRVIIMQKGRIVTDEKVSKLLDVFAQRSFKFRTESPILESTAKRINAKYPNAVIQTDKGCTEIELTFERGLHLYEVMDLLRDEGHTLRSVEHLTPNLSEIFLKLIREGA